MSAARARTSMSEQARGRRSRRNRSSSPSAEPEPGPCRRLRPAGRRAPARSCSEPETGTSMSRFRIDDARLRPALSAFAETARAPNLRRLQLSFGAAWAAEWALTVGIGILAFREGGATALGVVGLARMLPAALLAPLAAVAVD